MPGGRPRKPVQAKILAGTYRADRDGDPASLVRAAGSPVAPAHLSGEALAFWGRIVPGLVASGVAAACDGPALTAMCEWWARYRRYSEALDAAPADGDAYQLLVMVGISTTNFDRLASRFGLTPSDRAKLRTEPKTVATPVPPRKRG